MCGKIHTPGEGSRADQHLEQALAEELLHKVPVRPEHPCVVDSKSCREKLLQLAIPRGLHGIPGQAQLGPVSWLETAKFTILSCLF